MPQVQGVCRWVWGDASGVILYRVDNGNTGGVVIKAFRILLALWLFSGCICIWVAEGGDVGVKVFSTIMGLVMWVVGDVTIRRM